MLLGFMGCRMSLGYGAVHFDGFSEEGTIDHPSVYLEGEKFESFRVRDVIVIPRMKKSGGDSYELGFFAYSSSKDITVSIEIVELHSEEGQINIPRISIEIPLTQVESFYGGSKSYCLINDHVLNAKQGQEYQLTAQVAVVTPSGERIEKTIYYTAKAAQAWSFASH